MKRFFTLIKISLVYLLVLINMPASSQNENLKKIKLIAYEPNDSIKYQLYQIVHKLKEHDKDLTFIISIEDDSSKKKIYISTTFDVNLKSIYDGYFELDSSLFLIRGSDDFFFKKIGERWIIVNAKKALKNNEIVTPYIDELPIWILGYKDGIFSRIYSSY